MEVVILQKVMMFQKESLVSKMIREILWPSEFFSKKNRVVFCLLFVICFFILISVKSRVVDWDRDFYLNLIVFLYTIFACYGFLFDKVIPTPPVSSGYDRLNTNLQCIRGLILLSSMVLLIWLTFSGGWLI